MKAIWNDTVIAESGATVVVEGNHYFPRDSVKAEFLLPSETTTVCGWKGTAHYYTIQVDGKTNPDATWYYPQPEPAAEQIRDHLAFWNGVQVTD